MAPKKRVSSTSTTQKKNLDQSKSPTPSRSNDAHEPPTELTPHDNKKRQRTDDGKTSESKSATIPSSAVASSPLSSRPEAKNDFEALCISIGSMIQAQHDASSRALAETLAKNTKMQEEINTLTEENKAMTNFVSILENQAEADDTKAAWMKQVKWGEERLRALRDEQAEVQAEYDKTQQEITVLIEESDSPSD